MAIAFQCTHCAHIVQEWFQEHDEGVMMCGHGPDLNLVERLWAVLESTIHSSSTSQLLE